MNDARTTNRIHQICAGNALDQRTGSDDELQMRLMEDLGVVLTALRGVPSPPLMGPPDVILERKEITYCKNQEILPKICLKAGRRKGGRLSITKPPSNRRSKSPHEAEMSKGKLPVVPPFSIRQVL
jgi:hypothetical protein